MVRKLPKCLPCILWNQYGKRHHGQNTPQVCGADERSNGGGGAIVESLY
jgi:hypothetical protein